MGGPDLRTHRKLGIFQGLVHFNAGEPPGVEALHQLLGLLVGNGPERHEDCLRSGFLQGAAQAENAFAIFYVTLAGVAGAEDDKLGASQVEISGFQGGKDAVVEIGRGGFPARGGASSYLCW